MGWTIHETLGAERRELSAERPRETRQGASLRAGARESFSHAPAAPLDRRQREEAEQRGEDQIIAR
jgi:hypothetical protein